MTVWATHSGEWGAEKSEDVFGPLLPCQEERTVEHHPVIPRVDLRILGGGGGLGRNSLRAV